MNVLERTFSEQSTLHFCVSQLFVAFDGDVAHFHLLLFIDVDIENDLIFVCDVIALQNLDVRILVSFVIEVFLRQEARPVDDVGSNLSASQQSEFLFQVFPFRFLYAAVVDG